MLQARELNQIIVPDQILPADLSAARYYIEKAAYLGFAKAQTKMGAAYELCQLGCDFDPTLSLHYNALAARQGESEAEMAISKWFLCGQQGVFEKNDELAFTYAERAAKNGLPTAEFAMGYFYEVGIHVRSDLNEAKTWYEKAAEHGYAEAAARIEGISRSNTLSKKDHQDIAIARIRSTHGSQRGKRPDRFKAHEHMPTIQDSNLEMPEPHLPKPYSEERRASTPSQFQRPASVAPYPDDGVFNVRPGPLPAHARPYSNPNFRAGLDTRPASVASSAPGPSRGDYGSSSVVSTRPPRSFSSQDNPGAGRGRGALPYNVAPGVPRPVTNMRPSSSLSNMTSVGSASSVPSTLHQSNIDIGYSAPLDPPGPDRRGRLQKTGNRPMSGPEQASKPSPTPVQGNRNPQRLSSLPDTQIYTRQNQKSNFNRQDIQPPPPTSQSQMSAPTPRLQSSQSTPSLPPKVPIIDQPVSTPSSNTKPPGKGPKTFEEMGVPAQKQKDECVGHLVDEQTIVKANIGVDIDVKFSRAIFFPKCIAIWSTPRTFCHERRIPFGRWSRKSGNQASANSMSGFCLNVIYP